MLRSHLRTYKHTSPQILEIKSSISVRTGENHRKWVIVTKQITFWQPKVCRVMQAIHDHSYLQSRADLTIENQSCVTSLTSNTRVIYSLRAL